MRKKLKIAAIVVVSLVVVAGLLFWRQYTLLMRHFYVYGIYANALWYYHDTFGTFPSSLQQLDDTYGKLRDRRANVPPPPPWPPPTFRPLPASPVPGRYLVIIEPKPREFLYLLRVIVFALPADGTVECKMVWEWQVDDLIAQDDRVRASAPTTAASQP